MSRKYVDALDAGLELLYLRFDFLNVLAEAVDDGLVLFVAGSQKVFLLLFEEFAGRAQDLHYVQPRLVEVLVDLQLLLEVLFLGRGSRVRRECRARAVHELQLRADGSGAGGRRPLRETGMQLCVCAVEGGDVPAF